MAKYIVTTESIGDCTKYLTPKRVTTNWSQDINDAKIFQNKNSARTSVEAIGIEEYGFHYRIKMVTVTLSTPESTDH